MYAAGPYFPMAYTGDIEPERFAHQMANDTLACFNLVQPALPALRRSRGSIVAVSTPAVRRFPSRDLLSAAPKAAIEQIVRGIAVEYGKFGVRANAVGVGLLEDGMFEDLMANGDYTESILDLSRRAIPLRRFGSAPTSPKRWRSWRRTGPAGSPARSSTSTAATAPEASGRRPTS